MLSYRRFIMTRTIENSFLKISVSDHGAELTGIYDKTNDREILWQADPAYWKRHAPVLFPNVGRNYKDIWRLNGKEYPSRQHGFARDSDFICTDITDTSLSFVLKSSEETLKVYPFAFAIRHSVFRYVKANPRVITVLLLKAWTLLPISLSIRL